MCVGGGVLQGHQERQREEGEQAGNWERKMAHVTKCSHLHGWMEVVMLHVIPATQYFMSNKSFKLKDHESAFPLI